MMKPSRKILGLGALLLGGSVAIACGGGGGTTDATATGGATGGTTTGGTGTGAGTSSGGVSTGGGATGGAATGGSSSNYDKTCTDAVCASTGLIDDFTRAPSDKDVAKLGGDLGTTGYWFSYTSDEAGNVPPGVDITDPKDGIADGKLSVTATGLATKLSAGFGVELNQVSKVGCGLDASAFAGIRVVLKGTSGDSLLVNAVMPDVVPTSSNGTCVEGCYDTHFKKKTLASDSTETWDIPWSDFAQMGWGTAVEFDPSKIAKLQFSSAAGTSGFSVEIDEVSFYGTGTGSCDGGGGAGGAAP